MPRMKSDMPGTPRIPIALAVPREEASQKIQRQIDEGEGMLIAQSQNERELNVLDEKVNLWTDYNKQLLITLFNTTEVAEEYAAFWGTARSMMPSFEQLVEYTREEIQVYLTRLRSINKRLELFQSPRIVVSPEPARHVRERGNEIFIVHGHNSELKEAVARFLEHLKLKVTILHEQPNKGRTLIEKFEDYSNVGYAIVLLTADDIGSLKEKDATLRPRARQNVLLELGYFLGKLERSNVCALKEEGVEEPSDISGVLYIPFDASGAWKLKLAREIKAAGIDVDMNLAI